MKNACLILVDNTNVLVSERALLLLDGFASHGYTFSELRAVSIADKTSVETFFIDMKQGYDNVVMIATRVDLPKIREMLKEVFNHEYFQGTTGGAGMYEENGKTLFLLADDCEESGVGYVRNVCVPYLNKKYNTRYEKLVIRTVGAKDEYVEELIAKARQMSERKLFFSKEKKYDEHIIEIFYNESASKMLVDDVLRLFAEGLQDSLYALNDTSLERLLIDLLKIRGKKLSVAESFTGGGLAKRIVSISGASEVYVEGLNTYAELSKIKRLGVSDYTLRTAGAVSEQTAYEMAAGLLASGDCDLAIATTGLAGPKSDRSGLPVGLCCIAIGIDNKVYVCRYKFDGTREEIMEKGIQYALFLACRQLKNS